MGDRQPAYVVMATISNPLIKKPKTVRIPVYGDFSNPWKAQEAAARKLDRLGAVGRVKQGWPCGDVVFDRPIPVGSKLARGPRTKLKAWGLIDDLSRRAGRRASGK